MLYPWPRYPGYRIWAKEIEDSIEYKSDLPPDLIFSVAKEMNNPLVVICWPGNPVGSITQIKSEYLSKLASVGDVVIDATYCDPFSEQFKALVTDGIASEVSVIFSFSKTLGLPSARLGGELAPTLHSDLMESSNRFPWDIFQSSLISAVMSKEGMALMKGRVSRLNYLHSDVVSAARGAGLKIAYCEASNFITVYQESYLKFLENGHKELVGKSYLDEGLFRIDVSPRNLMLLRTKE